MGPGVPEQFASSPAMQLSHTQPTPARHLNCRAKSTDSHSAPLGRPAQQYLHQFFFAPKDNGGAGGGQAGQHCPVSCQTSPGATPSPARVRELYSLLRHLSCGASWLQLNKEAKTFRRHNLQTGASPWHPILFQTICGWKPLADRANLH